MAVVESCCTSQPLPARAIASAIRRAGDGQDQALDEHLLDQPPPRGAKRQPHGDLVAPRADRASSRFAMLTQHSSRTMLGDPEEHEQRSLVGPLQAGRTAGRRIGPGCHPSGSLRAPRDRTVEGSVAARTAGLHGRQRRGGRGHRLIAGRRRAITDSHHVVREFSIAMASGRSSGSAPIGHDDIEIDDRHADRRNPAVSRRRS